MSKINWLNSPLATYSKALYKKVTLRHPLFHLALMRKRLALRRQIPLTKELLIAKIKSKNPPQIKKVHKTLLKTIVKQKKSKVQSHMKKRQQARTPTLKKMSRKLPKRKIHHHAIVTVKMTKLRNQLKLIRVQKIRLQQRKRAIHKKTQQRKTRRMRVRLIPRKKKLMSHVMILLLLKKIRKSTQKRK